MLSSFILILINLAAARVDYTGQQILQCKVTSPEVAKQLINYDIFSHGNGTVTLRVRNDREKRTVNRLANCHVVESDLNKLAYNHQVSPAIFLAEGKALSDDQFFSDYQSYDTIKQQFKDWANKYPKFAKFIPSIGKSIEGRDIFAFEITNSEVNTKKRDIIYLGGQHAREWISPATVSYISNNLLKNAESDSEIKEHLSQFIFRIVPVVNPDGYEYSRNKDRLWRKNRRKNSDGSYGVDLNRNWDEHWCQVGASKNPNQSTYCGTKAESEPEVQSVVKYVMNLPNRYGCIDWHSYGQLILRNWGWTKQPSQNEAILKKIGDSIAEVLKSKGYDYTSESGADLYPASGASDDWAAVHGRMVSYTIELCPGSNGNEGFELSKSQIIPCASAAYAGSKKFTQLLIENPNIPYNKPPSRFH